MSLAKEDLQACYVCGKVWKREDVDNYLYFMNLLVCKYHNGAKEWYEGAIKLVSEKMDLQFKEI